MHTQPHSPRPRPKIKPAVLYDEKRFKTAMLCGHASVIGELQELPRDELHRYRDRQYQLCIDYVCDQVIDSINFFRNVYDVFGSEYFGVLDIVDYEFNYIRLAFEGYIFSDKPICRSDIVKDEENCCNLRVILALYYLNEDYFLNREIINDEPYPTLILCSSSPDLTPF